MRKFNYLPKSAVLIALLLALIAYTSVYKTAVYKALLSCGNVLIPSLFPFFVLSAFTVYTNSMSRITRHMKLTSKLLAVPYEGINAVILCMIGGFPVGAKAAAMLFSEKRISRSASQKLVYCCVGAGPGFLITFIGENLLCSKAAGILLLVSNTLSVLTLLIFYRKPPIEKEQNTRQIENISFGEAIVHSTEQAVHTALSMCGFVVIFTVLNDLMLMLPFYSDNISALMEITCGIIANTGRVPLWLTAFYIGFGGICVHFQIYGISKEIGISKLKFTFFRLLQGILSAVYMRILVIFFPVSIQTFYDFSSKTELSVSGTVWGAAAIVLLSVIFLISIGHNHKQEVNLCAE